MRRAILLVLSLILLTIPGLAQQPVASVEGITEYHLDNGLKVLLFPDPSAPKTTVNITYMVGSRHEGYGETGMAHLLEHLLFKGSTKHTNIPQELSEHGASPNGTTWYDRTNYYETFPASDENLEWALSLEADRMVNSFVAKKDLDSEMTVVRNEFESGENSPTGILMERTLSTAFLWHNYGNDTIGARADIEDVPIERLQAFYRKYYQPDNAILVVAGKFDPEHALELINKYFGPIPRPERKLIGTYTEEPTQDGEREVTLRRVGDIKALCAVYHIPAGSHPDFAAIEVLGEVLGDTPSGRLYKALVETKLVTSVGGGAFQLREPGTLIFLATLLKDGALEKAREVMLQTIETFPQTPPTEEEVERAKKALLKNMESSFRNSQSMALQLSEWAGMGDWRLFFLHRDRLEKVTTNDVLRVSQQYLKTSNRTVGSFIPTEKPERAEIPETPDVDKLVADYKGREAMQMGEVFDPSPENIQKRTETFQLSDKVKVAFLPKKNRGSTVNINIRFRFGSLEAVRGEVGNHGVLAGSMLDRGTTTLTRQQIKDKLVELEASGGVGGDYDSVTASFKTTHEHLGEVIRLGADMMKNPSFPEKEFEQLIDEWKAGLEASRSEPQSMASNALRRHLSPYDKGHPMYVSTIDEDLESLSKIKLEELKAFHQNFYGASQGEIAVVGDFDPDEIRKVLEEEFKDWKSPADYQRIETESPDQPVINESLSVPDKANAVFLGAKNLQLLYEHPDAPALRLADYIMGGGFLNSRLATRIRQKEGLSYGVGSSVSFNNIDPGGSLSVYAIAAPENIAKVEAAMKEEYNRAMAEGFTAEEVEAAKSGYLESRKVERGQDGTLASILQSNLYLDRTMQWTTDWEQKIQALTPEQLQVVAKKYFDPESLSIVKAGSFNK